jgi:hypothetical protein
VAITTRAVTHLTFLSSMATSFSYQAAKHEDLIPTVYEHEDFVRIPRPSGKSWDNSTSVQAVLLTQSMRVDFLIRNNAPTLVRSIPPVSSGRIFARKNFSRAPETGKSQRVHYSVMQGYRNINVLRPDFEPGDISGLLQAKPILDRQGRLTSPRPQDVVFHNELDHYSNQL